MTDRDTDASTDTAHYVYVLRCADDTLYTGYTTDPARRTAEHDAGAGAKYTRGRTPVELVHVERFDTKSGAMSREYAVKQLTRAQKDRLVEGERSAAGDSVPPSTVRD